jgi:acetylornithine deacetylase/succinyl-diaminopimelate desuccinylase-like protein
MKLVSAAAVFAAGFAIAAQANAQAPSQAIRPDQAAFRELYRELIETNTTISQGDCTLAARRMGARLTAAGLPEADVRVFSTPDHPKEGGLFAVLRGSDPKQKAILLLAHIDVVEARREDWTRDPFKLVEEDGYFFARGASDDKAMAAVIVDTLVRFKQEGFKPRRDVKLALTCGEETEGVFNGADYLVKQQRPWIDAAFALNEGAINRLDAQGKPIALGVQAGEKVYQDFTLEVTNPGGHSSRPVRDNAITHLADALSRIGRHDFAVRFNEVTRGYFTRMAPIVGGESGASMTALVADPNDAKALESVTRDPSWNSTLRTTCVATMLSGGHAQNALPQRATANVNCRIFPSDDIEAVRQELVRVAADDKVSIKPAEGELGTRTPVPPLTAEIMGPIEKAAAEVWPGVPVVPAMATGATDGKYLNQNGIPTYGLTGMFQDADGGGVHGLNERIRVKSLYDGRDFLYRVIRLYAQ